jgi:hypothetical protein
MLFRVSSSKPVIYLADSRFFRREVQALEVNADSDEYAIRHFLKVTTGDAGLVTCAVVDKMALRAAPLAIEPPDAEGYVESTVVLSVPSSGV